MATQSHRRDVRRGVWRERRNRRSDGKGANAPLRYAPASASKPSSNARNASSSCRANRFVGSSSTRLSERFNRSSAASAESVAKHRWSNALKLRSNRARDAKGSVPRSVPGISGSSARRNANGSAGMIRTAFALASRTRSDARDANVATSSPSRSLSSTRKSDTCDERTRSSSASTAARRRPVRFARKHSDGRDSAHASMMARASRMREGGTTRPRRRDDSTAASSPVSIPTPTPSSRGTFAAPDARASSRTPSSFASSSWPEGSPLEAWTTRMGGRNTDGETLTAGRGLGSARGLARGGVFASAPVLDLDARPRRADADRSRTRSSTTSATARWSSSSRPNAPRVADSAGRTDPSGATSRLSELSSRARPASTSRAASPPGARPSTPTIRDDTTRARRERQCDPRTRRDESGCSTFSHDWVSLSRRATTDSAAPAECEET